MGNGSDLSPEQHAVVELILTKGRTHDEIARALGMRRERVERLAREAADALGVGEGSQADEAHRVATGAAEEEQAEHAEANRRTLPMFALYLAVIASGIAAAIVLGFAREADDPAARETVARFAAAIEREDGEAACAELTDDARSNLESQEKKPCEEAILSLELSGGEVARVDVADTSAAVDLTEGDRAYLDRTPEGWRIGEAGCRPRPGEPYDCELQS